MSVIAAVVGLAVVGTLVWLTGVVSAHTQRHLLQLQASQAGAVIGEIAPTIKTPLGTVVGVAGASDGSAAQVRAYAAPYVGRGAGHLFDSLSVWRLGGVAPVKVLSVGQAPRLAPGSRAFGAFVTGIQRPGTLSVKGLLSGASPHLAFAVESAGAAPRFVAYAESPLPASRHATIPPSSAFDQLGFALYLGRPAPANLLEATAASVPTSGPIASVPVPFGTSKLYLVAWATQTLGGGVLPALPWIIAVVGIVLVATGVVTTEWLVRRRRGAERLARENRRLYTEQRSIAQKLQEALLPKQLPKVEGIEVAARYISGDPAADIGGDWYDLIRCDDRSFVFAVGDVSGRGVPAANTMASLHYAIRAYAAQGDDTTTILQKLAELLDVGRDGHFATVLLGHVDVPRRRITLANAGHLPPLLVNGDGTRFLDTRVGAPIGVATGARYSAVTQDAPPGAAILAYTDGLVERRGEILDVGLERLRSVASGRAGDCRALLDAAASIATEGAGDDVAMLALRWTT